MQSSSSQAVSIKSPDNQTISLGESFALSATALTSGAKDLISTPANISIAGISAYMVTLERVLGWVLFALFLAALGKTVIR